jgi:hypothetical protein
LECRDATARKSNYLVENLLRLIGNNFDAGVRQHHSNPKHRKVAIFQLVYLFAGITHKQKCLPPPSERVFGGCSWPPSIILGARRSRAQTYSRRRAGTLRVPRNKKASRRDYLQIIVILEL